MFFDTHSHCLIKNNIPDLPSIFYRAKAAGVKIILDCAVNSNDFFERHRILMEQKGVYLSAGASPECAGGQISKHVETLEQILQNYIITAVGETGIDLFHHQNLKEQIILLEKQLVLAEKYEKPVILHIRNAYPEIIPVLKNYKIRYINHCFSGNADDLYSMLELGSYISFAGNITYKNSVHLVEALKLTPRNRLLLETDSPFLSPAPFRGKNNEPALLAQTAEFVRKALGADETLFTEIFANALAAFNISTPEFL